jgi:hypothetical protein
MSWWNFWKRKDLTPQLPKCYRCRQEVHQEQSFKTFRGKVYHAYCFRKSKKEGISMSENGEILNFHYYD